MYTKPNSVRRVSIVCLATAFLFLGFLALAGPRVYLFVVQRWRVAALGPAMGSLKKYDPILEWGYDGCLTGLILHLDESDPGEEIEQLRCFPTLESLTLIGRGCTDATLARMGTFNGLTFLDVFNGEGSKNLTDAGLSQVAKMPSLESLSYYGGSITDRGMECLGALHNLKSLDIECRGATEKSLQFLSKLERLEELTLLNGKAMTGEGLALMPAPLALKRLYISTVTDGGMRAIARFTNLHKLSVGGELTAGGLSQVRELRTLEELRIETAGRFDNDALAQSVEHLGHLRTLRIAQCPIFGDALKNLRSLKNIEVLSISTPSIDDQGVPFLKDLPRLRVLNLNGTSVTKVSMRELLHLQGLEELAVPFVVQESDEMRKELFEALPNLFRFRSANGTIEFPARDMRPGYPSEL